MMPSRPWPWWLLTGLLLTSFPLVSLAYWIAVLEADLLPPVRDSISIPIFASVIATLLATPVILGIAWLCLQRYPDSSLFLAWRRDRPWRSVLVTLACLLAAGSLCWEIVAALRASSFWHDYLWPAYLGLWLPWLAGMRAAAMGRTAA